MSIDEIKWNSSEKKNARTAFDKAYKNEIDEIKSTIKEKAENIENASDVWSLHDYLSSRRKEIDEKYDYRYSQLLFIFPTLISQNYISVKDLSGLSEEKISIIQKFLS